MFCWPASRYNRVKKNQLDAQIIRSIFRQPVHISGVSRPIIRRYNCTYTTVGTYYSFQLYVCCPGQQTSKKSKYQLLYTYGCSPDDGPRYARNMWRLTKYTKLCIKFVFLHTVFPNVSTCLPNGYTASCTRNQVFWHLVIPSPKLTVSRVPTILIK